MGSIATKFNFFIHNLAQLRFSGLPSNDEPILSFSPKTYSFRQDGRIKEASVFTYHKKYNPDKHYVSLFHMCRLSYINVLLSFIYFSLIAEVLSFDFVYACCFHRWSKNKKIYLKNYFFFLYC